MLLESAEQLILGSEDIEWPSLDSLKESQQEHASEELDVWRELNDECLWVCGTRI